MHRTSSIAAAAPLLLLSCVAAGCGGKSGSSMLSAGGQLETRLTVTASAPEGLFVGAPEYRLINRGVLAAPMARRLLLTCPGISKRLGQRLHEFMQQSAKSLGKWTEPGTIN